MFIRKRILQVKVLLMAFGGLSITSLTGGYDILISNLTVNQQGEDNHNPLGDGLPLGGDA
jgi:hypothetical protein